MVPYFFLLFIPAIFPSVLYPARRFGLEKANSNIISKRNESTISLFFIGLFILLALRDITVGRDLIQYEIIFERCYAASFEELPDLRWELGYTIYNKIISLISNEYRFLLIVTAFIILKPIYTLYSKEKKFGYLLIVLFINMPCFLMMFSGLRQAIATSIGILVYMAIEEKRYFKGCLLILIAMSFHTSAFVLFLLYPAFFVRIKTKHLPFIVPALMGIYIFRTQILMLMLAVLPSKYIEFYGELQQTGAFGMMLLFFIFIAFAFAVLDEEAMSNEDFFMRNILLLATVLQLFVPIHGLIQRASYYFLIFVPVAILHIVQMPKKRWTQISNFAVVVMGCFFSLYFFYNASFSTDNLLDVFPYKFFWSGQKW